jgi:hypothetical protein
MTIQITRPEIEKLIQERLQSGSLVMPRMLFFKPCSLRGLSGPARKASAGKRSSVSGRSGKRTGFRSAE